MSSFDFDQRLNRYDTHSLKWDAVGEVFGYEELFPMWVADMDFKSPPKAVEAIVERAQHGVYGYSGDYSGYKEAVHGWLDQRFDWQIDPDWLQISPGVVPSLNMMVRSFTNPGDKVIVQSPVYPPFFKIAQNNGCHVVNNQLLVSHGKYFVDFDDLEAKASDSRTKVLLLCSPHNPVGRVWTKEELRTIAEICDRHDVLVISDEIHADLTFPGIENHTMAKVADFMLDKIIVCNSPAKTFNIPGLQISNAIVPDKKLRQTFLHTMESVGISKPNVFGLVGGEACFRHGAEWLDSLRGYLYDNYQFLCNYVQSNYSDVQIIEAQGTYLSWLDVREKSQSSLALQRELLAKSQVALQPGDNFGPGGEGFLRLNFGCPQKMLQEGLERMKVVME